jgi:hypothetical protein
MIFEMKLPSPKPDSEWRKPSTVIAILSLIVTSCFSGVVVWKAFLPPSPVPATQNPIIPVFSGLVNGTAGKSSSIDIQNSIEVKDFKSITVYFLLFGDPSNYSSPFPWTQPDSVNYVSARIWFDYNISNSRSISSWLYQGINSTIQYSLPHAHAFGAYEWASNLHVPIDGVSMLHLKVDFLCERYKCPSETQSGSVPVNDTALHFYLIIKATEFLGGFFSSEPPKSIISPTNHSA